MRTWTICALLLSLPLSAEAIVVGGAVTGGTAFGAGGTFAELAANSSFAVGDDTFQDPNLYAFNENQNIVVANTIPVNIGTAPAAGDIVASHYVFFDPVADTQTGYVDFDADIYGVATSTSVLAQSDFLQNNNVTYLNPTFRGLEAGDSVAIDPSNPARLLVDWFASTPGDYVRVFTQFSAGAGTPPIPMDPDDDMEMHAVPVPGAFALMLLALSSLAAIGARRRQPA